jgi:hypothetical protein
MMFSGQSSGKKRFKQTLSQESSDWKETEQHNFLNKLRDCQKARLKNEEIIEPYDGLAEKLDY